MPKKEVSASAETFGGSESSTMDTYRRGKYGVTGKALDRIILDRSRRSTIYCCLIDLAK